MHLDKLSADRFLSDLNSVSQDQKGAGYGTEPRPVEGSTACKPLLATYFSTSMPQGIMGRPVTRLTF